MDGLDGTSPTQVGSSESETLAELRRENDGLRRALRALGKVPPGGALDHPERASVREMAELAQDELSRTERVMRHVFNAAADAMILVDEQGRFLDVNPAGCALYGLPRGRLLRSGSLDVMAELNLARSLSEGGHARFELNIQRPTGENRRVDCAVTAHVLPSLHIAVLRDVTESRKAEAALRQSEERLRTVIANAPLILFALDTAGVLTFIDGKGLQLAGPSARLLLGGSFFQEPEKDSAFQAHVSAVLAGESRRWRGQVGDAVFESILQPLWDETGRIKGAIGVSFDVTEGEHAERALRKSEQELRQSQKMDAVGRLAGGIAHDFNNLLSVILGYADLILEALGPLDPVRAEVEEVRLAGARASALTKQLLAFSRQQVLALRVLDLSEVLASMENMLTRLLGEDVRLSIDIDAARVPIKADVGQVEQVIMNLAVNARDAMPGGGSLQLRTSSVAVDEAFVARHPGAQPGAYARLTVSDTGTGMDPATQARIFEPFFTTKDLGKGTGLGLATVFGIVLQSGGFIEVKSEQGHGTRFDVYLPCSAESETAAVAPPRLTPIGGRPNATILLVEDDDQVRALARNVLQRDGYRVLDAQNAGAALLLAEQNSGAIDLLLSDVVMPILAGPKLAERLCALRPDLRVLLMSGYAEDKAICSVGTSERVPFLQKPLTPASLVDAVRAVLGGDPGQQ